ncbi:ABC transporter permease [Dermacoccaceae bacterium W4C1]
MNTTPTRTGSTPQDPSAGARTSHRRAGAQLIAVVLGLCVVIALMLFAFATPAVNSGAHQLPIAASGPSAALDQLQQQLEKAQPGAFELTRVADPAAAQSEIRDRDAVGAISLTSEGALIQTATAAGAPYTQALHGVGSALSQSGTTVTYRDVAPLTSEDPTGAGLSALGLPLVFGGMISAVVLSNLFRRSIRMRALGSVAFAALAGMTASWMLHSWLGTMDGHYWQVAGALALGIAAISLTILGLESLLGYAGLGIGAVVMMFLANPLSAIATGPDWLPDPWGTIGQLLPVGAAGSLARSVAFFDGGAGAHVIVLLCWVGFGAVLLALAAVRKRRSSQGELQDKEAHDPQPPALASV